LTYPTTGGLTSADVLEIEQHIRRILGNFGITFSPCNTLEVEDVYVEERKWLPDRKYRMKDVSRTKMWDSVAYLRKILPWAPRPVVLLTNVTPTPVYGATQRGNGILVEPGILGSNRRRGQVVAHELFHWFTGYVHEGDPFPHLPSLPIISWEWFLTRQSFQFVYSSDDERESITKCVAEWLVENGHAVESKQNPKYIK
jgi:hypothetical protein